MGKNKHSGGGNCQGRGCIPKDNYVVPEPDSTHKVTIIRVPEYEIDKGFKMYRTPDVFKYFDRAGRSEKWYPYPYPTPDILDPGKCYEYVYVDRFGTNGDFYSTMKPIYAGKYVTTDEYLGLDLGTAQSKFILEGRPDNEHYVITPSLRYLFGAPDTIDSITGLNNAIRRPTFFREVPCKPVEIPSLQFLAYRGIPSEVKEELHETTNILPPTAGGNAVKRNKRSRRNTRRKSRRNTRGKSRRNKL